MCLCFFDRKNRGVEREGSEGWIGRKRIGYNDFSACTVASFHLEVNTVALPYKTIQVAGSTLQMWA
jgi:hypothetical protein